MLAYIIKRLLFLIPSLLGITLVTFILIKNIPGDPVYTLVGERADPALMDHYKKTLGLDKSFTVQYFNYLLMVVKGDLGVSYYTHKKAAEIFWQKFPNTLKLASFAIIMAFFIGVSAGIIAALFKDRFLDRFIMFLSSCGISLPVFWLGLILIIIFILNLHWVPGTGMGNGGIAYLLLPALTLGLRSMAYIGRITRASMLEVFNQLYVISAKARGVGKLSLIIKHSLKNAMIPVITITALDLGSYLSGAVLTETVFGWDGIGRMAVTAIFKRDYPVILVMVLWSAVIFVVINLVADIICQLINPKIR